MKVYLPDVIDVTECVFVTVVIIYDKFNNTLTPVDSNMPKMSISKKLKTKGELTLPDCRF